MVGLKGATAWTTADDESTARATIGSEEARSESPEFRQSGLSGCEITHLSQNQRLLATERLRKRRPTCRYVARPIIRVRRRPCRG
ncbi:hypothetical protein Har1130_02360 [Haloarcula sp. CBA1130]|nr:hypothetical protein Har1129_17635 [Haloarcula sp. CBA1129]KAA9401641.1 hypothetical protein Har1130_02360 [Haloarcula sp. CBA1130]